jgi:SH3 domain-containing protein
VRPPMNQLLVALCLIAGTWYLVSTNLKNDQNDIPLRKESAPAPISVEQYKTEPISSEQFKLQPINPAAEQSGHAIVPDQSPAALLARSESPPQPAQPPQTEIGPTPGDRLQVKSEASIRSGPSASAQVIGTAHAGAKLQVQSRDAEWVQFVDPATKHAGWISLAFLGPAGDSVDVPTTVPKALKRPSRPAKLLGSAKPRNAQRKPQTTAQHKPVRPPRGYAELPRDQEFGPPRRGRFFGLFLRRRLSANELSPYPFR